MTLTDVASVGAGPCAAGHLPAPQDPGAGELRLSPQLPQSTLNSHPTPLAQRFSFSGGRMLGVDRASFIHPPPILLRI